MKARAFDFLADKLLEHSLLFSCAELIAAFSHIPSNSYNSNLEAGTICNTIRSAFFRVDNLIGLSFRNSQGAAITTGINSDPTSRPSGLYYFASRSTVDPSAIDPRTDLPSLTIEFLLPLPLTSQPLTSKSTVVPTVNRVLLNSFTSPTGGVVSTPVPPVAPLTLTDLSAFSASDFAALGTDTGNDTISDYARDGWAKFNADQLCHPMDRALAVSAANAASASLLAQHVVAPATPTVIPPA